MKGSETADEWQGGDFLRAIRVLSCSLVIIREGHGPILLRDGSGDAEQRLVSVRISRDGTHAEPVQDHSAAPEAQCDIGTLRNTALPAILKRVHARGTRDATEKHRDGIASLYALIAADVVTIPVREAWLRRLDWHLLRLRDVFPTSVPPAYPTLNDHWRHMLAQLGPKMEYMLLRDRATALDTKWYHALATSIPEVRALLPPLDPDTFVGSKCIAGQAARRPHNRSPRTGTRGGG